MDIATLNTILGRLQKEVFFCGSRLNTVYLFVKNKSCAAEILKLWRKTALAPNQIKIRLTRSLDFKNFKSLEAMLKQLPHDQIFLDPTAIIERSRSLVRIAHQARISIPHIKGCYFKNDTRSIHFLISPSLLSQGLSDLKQQIKKLTLSHLHTLKLPFNCSIELSTSMPQGKIIAIDAKSLPAKPFPHLMTSLLTKLKWPFLIASAASGLSLTQAQAEQAHYTLPAVSKANGWLGIDVGGAHMRFGGGAGVFADGALAAPLGQDFGLQIHAQDGGFSHFNLWAADGYLFWRNPTTALFGPHATYINLPYYSESLAGLHGEGYWNQWTVVAEGGGIFSNNTGNSWYLEALAHWYIQPSWKVHAGAIGSNKNGGAEIGTEYQFGWSSLPGLSIFADAGAGNHDLRYGFIGLRYYFGDNKSLIRRHREDNVLPTLDITLLGNQDVIAPKSHS